MIDATPLLWIYIGLIAAGQGLEILAEQLNAYRISRMRGRPPEALAGWIGAADLDRIERYSLDKMRFGRIRSAAGAAILVVLLWSGVLPWLVDRIAGWGNISAGLVFFGAVGALFFAADLPFDYAAVFSVEQKHGFNTRTLHTWVADTVKGAVLSATIFAALLAALLLVIRLAGPAWWIWAWSVVIAFQAALVLAYPSLIAPIFNTFTPVEDPELRRRILDMAEQAGIRIRRIDQMDASLRTRHTNAYFAGLGKTRRIVLFDSLLAAHDHDEVLSILAHEIGHLKRRHIPKQQALSAAAGFAAFAAAGVLIAWPGLYAGFGFSRPAPYVGLFLSGLLLQSLSVFLSPAAAAVSRRFEREADRYALALTGSSKGLCRALKKMARDNLTNLFPHPLYVALHYSHPPIIERLDHLGCGKPENSDEKMSKLNP
ncbi:MAG: M48 family metallopeptidase [Desulfobacterales bacterium]|nr:M48 family metallopeptidase [Desulfobacterales bacterium]